MYRDTKWVTAKNLKVGDKIQGWKIGSSRWMCSKIVKEVTPFRVRVVWRMEDEGEWVDASAMFEVELTDKEFYTKYQKDVEELQVALQNKLLRDEIGYHEMWNTWIAYDLYELAHKCREEKLKFIGWTEDITPKHSWAGQLLDVGLCAENEDRERFWCHVSRDIFDYFERSVKIAERVLFERRTEDD